MSRKYHLLIHLFLGCYFCACSEEPTDPATREERVLVSSPQSTAPVQFVDVTEEAGLFFKHTNGARSQKYFPETMCGGGMFWDYDNDGNLDIYLVNGNWLDADTTDKPVNALYHNEGDGYFREVGSQAGVDHAGYGNGCAAGDYDNDGDLDLFLTNFGPNVLFRNDGNGRFTDQTARAGVGDARWSTSCAFTDYDRDGDLDLFVANYVEYDLARADEATMPYVQNPEAYKGDAKAYPHPANFAGATDVLYRNDGDGSFTDVTRAAGLCEPEGKGLGVMVADYTNDGWPDIFVTNDAVRNFMFLNNGNGTFREVGVESGTAYGQDGQREASMGIDAGDYDRDGDLDLTVVNFQGEPNALYNNRGEGFFLAHTFPSGIGLITLPFLGFGTVFLDYDNDGYLDLFVANGHVLDNIELFDQSTTYPQRNFLFRNVGPNRYGIYTFTEVGSESGPGMQVEKVSRGSAVGDYDNDGDADILAVNINHHPTLLRNDGGNRNNWLTIRTIGTASNRDGLGTRLILSAGDLRQMEEVKGTRSFLSQSDLRVRFGLGRAARVDSIEVRWPSGRVEHLENIAVNQFITIKESQGIVSP